MKNISEPCREMGLGLKHNLGQVLGNNPGTTFSDRRGAHKQNSSEKFSKVAEI
jgi:hypothetical protein